MSVVGGSVHDGSPYAPLIELIGETVLVQVTPTWTEFVRKNAYNPTNIQDKFHDDGNNKGWMKDKPHWLGNGVRQGNITGGEKGPFDNSRTKTFSFPFYLFLFLFLLFD